MELKVAVLAGDGIGPEISAVGVDVMTAVCEKFGHKVSYEYALCGAHAIDEVGDPFPEETYQVCKNADAVLFSAVGDPKFDNDPTAKVRPEQGLLAMRKKLGLFANIRPVQTFKCLLHKSPLRAELVEGADFLCIRELTGGMYFGEKYQDNDKAWDTNYYTRPEVERILRVGFEYAMKRRKHLTVVDKANVLASSRLWRQIAQEMVSRSDDGLHVCGQRRNEDDSGAAFLRRDGDREYLWRHPHRRGFRYQRFDGAASLSLYGREHAGIRAHPRFVAAGQGAEHRQSAGTSVVCGYALRILQPQGGGCLDTSCRRCFARCQRTHA